MRAFDHVRSGAEHSRRSNPTGPILSEVIGDRAAARRRALPADFAGLTFRHQFARSRRCFEIMSSLALDRNRED